MNRTVQGGISTMLDGSRDRYTDLSDVVDDVYTLNVIRTWDYFGVNS